MTRKKMLKKPILAQVKASQMSEAVAKKLRAAYHKKQTSKMTSREKILKYCKVVEKQNQLGCVLEFGKHSYRMNELLADLTDADCDRVFKNMDKNMGLNAYIKQVEKKKSTVSKRREAVASVDPKPCECGCGAITRRGSKFLPGHDMKLKSILRKAKTPEAEKELKSRGW